MLLVILSIQSGRLLHNHPSTGTCIPFTKESSRLKGSPLTHIPRGFVCTWALASGQLLHPPWSSCSSETLLIFPVSVCEPSEVGIEEGREHPIHLYSRAPF